jgi:hypothetical protein
MKKLFVLFIFIPVLALAKPLYSPTWGFFIDPPEGYVYTDGDARDRFSFSGPDGAMLDLVVYNGQFNTMLALVEDVNRRISNRGDVDFFQYNGKQAAIIKLIFGDNDGWGLVVELEARPDLPNRRPMLLALAYGPANRRSPLELFHISALDSIAPTAADRRYPGPIMEYSYPRGEPRNTPLAITGLSAMVHENDAEAAQVLIEREFTILKYYLNTPHLHDACIRYYRFIYRDSFDRIATAASVIAQHFDGHLAVTDEQKRAYAQRVLSFVQGFKYERDLTGSDFINLVTAITEGRGDCDSRAVLFAMILANANIRGAIMLSHHYSHAMGLADVTGSGARFEALGVNWLVAETTANINIGLIAQDESDPRHWFAVVFE